MNKQENKAGTHLVVSSLEVLEGNGLSGQGFRNIERKISDVEKSVTAIAGQQQDYWRDTASDNIITPTEKQSLKKEKVVIDTEYYGILQRATDAGVKESTAYDFFVSAYTNLNSYLTQIDLFGDMSKNTEIQNRERFITLYDDYYSTRDNLQDVITKGYIGEAHGLQDIGAVPAMHISSHAVKVNDEMNSYVPSRLSIEGRITNGNYSDPYNCIIEVYRNEEDTPVFTSEIVKAILYDIPDQTTSLRFVMKDVDSRLVYDDEKITFASPSSGLQVDIGNSFQVFMNGTPTRAEEDYAPDFTSTVECFFNEVSRPVYTVFSDEEEGIRVSFHDGRIHFTPDSEVKDEGEITLSVIASRYDSVAIGTESGQDKYIIGVGGYFIGMTGHKVVEKKITYRNYESLTYLEQQASNIESYYLGSMTSPEQISAIHDKKVGKYFLYTGVSTKSFIKGYLYQWTGSQWKRDESNEHATVAMGDMFTMIDSMPGLADSFVNHLFASKAVVKYLWSKVITLADGEDGAKGEIVSQHFDDTTGFKITSDGEAIFNKATVRGAIFADSGMFSGELKGASGDFTGTVTATDGSFTGSITLPSGKALKFNSGSTIQNIKVDGTTLTLVVS